MPNISLYDDMRATFMDYFMMEDIDDEMRRIVFQYNTRVYFDGLLAIALLPDNEWHKYSYFFQRLINNDLIMEFIFSTYSKALNHEDLILMDGRKDFDAYYNAFRGVLVNVCKMKDEKKPSEIIVDTIRHLTTRFKLFQKHLSKKAVERVGKNPASYVEHFIYVLKMMLIIYMRWMSNDFVFSPDVKDEEKINKYMKVMSEIHNFLNFKGNFRIVSFTLEDYLKVKKENEKKYISTGLRYFDCLFKDNPGYKKGWLFVVGGAYGMGKTKFLISLATNAVRQGFKVLHITAENDEDEVMEDYISAYRGKAFDNTNPYEMKEFEELSKYLKSKVKIIKVRPLDFTVDNINTFIEMMNNRDFEVDVLVVDSINLMTVPGVNGGGGASKYDKGEKIMLGLFDIAKNHDIAVLTCAQLQRQGVKKSQDGKEDEVEARSEDVSLSYAIPAFAHVYVTLNQSSDELRHNAMRIYVDKIRRGISKVTIPVIFDKGNMIIRDATEDEVKKYFGEKTNKVFDGIIKKRLEKLSGIDYGIFRVGEIKPEDDTFTVASIDEEEETISVPQQNEAIQESFSDKTHEPESDINDKVETKDDVEQEVKYESQEQENSHVTDEVIEIEQNNVEDVVVKNVEDTLDVVSDNEENVEVDKKRKPVDRIDEDFIKEVAIRNGMIVKDGKIYDGTGNEVEIDEILNFVKDIPHGKIDYDIKLFYPNENDRLVPYRVIATDTNEITEFGLIDMETDTGYVLFFNGKYELQISKDKKVNTDFMKMGYEYNNKIKEYVDEMVEKFMNMSEEELDSLVEDKDDVELNINITLPNQENSNNNPDNVEHIKVETSDKNDKTDNNASTDKSTKSK